MWQALVTDLSGATRAFVQDYDAIQVTPNLNGYREATIGVDPLDDAASELLIAERALKIYDAAGVLQFNGKLWEPLERSSGGVKVVARGPLAEFSWRRVRAQTLYTATNNAGGPWDAGQIVADRIAVQNGYRNTYLAMGTRQASQNRVRTYDPGLLEADLIAELAGAAGGFFLLEQPIDGTPGVMAQANVFYPAAGVSRENVRFEYGPATIDNCVDYTYTQSLPRTRETVSSSDATGNRIAAIAEDAAAIARFGLFEDEETFSDVTDANLLQQQAQGDLRLTPPTTIQMTTGLEAPVLFKDFNVGDFVRVKIVHGGFSFFGWARVASATLNVDTSGVENTSSIALELLTGGSPLGDPELAFYDQLDELRRRVEAIARAQQAATAPPAAVGASSDPTYVPPPDPTPPPPPPPPAPEDPPTINSFTAVGQWDATGSPYGVFTIDADGLGNDAHVVVSLSPGGARTPSVDLGATEARVQLQISPLASNTTYTATATVTNAYGSATASANFTTPSLRQS